MNAIRTIRKQLGVTQAELARKIGVSQSNVSFYEYGQTVPPKVAERIIQFASLQGVALTFDDIYRPDLATQSQREAA